MGETYTDILMIQRELRNQKNEIEKLQKWGVRGQIDSGGSDLVVLNEISLIKKELQHQQEFLKKLDEKIDGIYEILYNIPKEIENIIERSYVVTSTTSEPNMVEPSSFMYSDEPKEYIPDLDGGVYTESRVKDNETILDDSDFSSILESLDKLDEDGE